MREFEHEFEGNVDDSVESDLKSLENVLYLLNIMFKKYQQILNLIKNIIF
jgi:hypothetical protein